MARFNTALTSASITGTATIGSPNAGSFTNLTGTAPYTVTVPNPQLHPGVNQVFYNATSGTVTLTTPSGNFNGTGGNGTASISVFAGNVVSITSDGTHYIVISEDGSALTATTGSFSGNVTMNGSGATVSITPSTLTVAPTGASTIDSVAIGSTTRAAGAFTSLAANAAVTLTANTASSSTGTGTLVVTGGIGASGQVTATAVSATNLTGTLQTAAQPNITSVGTLTGLTINSGGGAGGIAIGSDAGRALYQYINFGGGNGGVDYAWQIGRSPNGGVGPADGFYFYDIKANATRVSINGSGNVGIGTANPSWPLTVKSGSSGTVATFLYDGAFAGTSEANIGLRWYNGGNANDIPQVKLRGYGTSNYTGNFGIDVLVGGTYPNGFAERFTIQGTTGNVGIGTTSPDAKLSIIDENGGQSMLQVRNYSTAATGVFSNAYTAEIRGASSGTQMHGTLIHLNESGYTTDRRTLDVSDYNGIFASFTNGKVGIGTTNPTVKLEVNGEIKSANIDINQNNNLLYFTKTGESSGTSANNTHFIGRVDTTGYHITSGAGGFDSVANSFVIGAKGSLILGTSTPTSSYTTGRVMITQTGDVGIGVQAPLHKLDVNGSLGVNELYGRTSRDTSGGNIDLTEYNAGNFTILEIFGSINPNSGGSSYRDPIHMYVYAGYGWNGSNLTNYIYVQHVAPVSRDIYPSGGGAGNVIDAVWYNGTTESDTVNAGTASYYVRLKAYNWNATYGSGFSVRVIRRA